MAVVEKAVPHGECHCGCGKKAPVAKTTDRHIGTVRGEPRKFIAGHVRPEHQDPVARFKERLLEGDDPDDCWIWMGAFDTAGYGAFMLNRDGKKRVSAHRYAYELLVGPIPKGKWILHSCDNRGCVNPRHLRPGTAKDNTADARERGRLKDPPTFYGATHPNSALSDDRARAIRSLTDQGWVGTDIAAAFGTTPKIVSDIKHRRTWNHLEEVTA